MGKLAVPDQVSGFEVRPFLRQFFDGITAITQDAGLAVDERDAALAQSRVIECRVVAQRPEVFRVLLNLAEVHRSDGPVLYGDFAGFSRAVVGDGERLAAHADGLFGGDARLLLHRVHGTCPRSAPRPGPHYPPLYTIPAPVGRLLHPSVSNTPKQHRPPS